MVLKILLMFFSLIAIIYAIIKFNGMDLDYKYDEAEGMFIPGAIIYCVSWVFMLGFTIVSMIPGNDDCGCGDNTKIALFFVGLMAIGGIMVAEPFVRHIVDKIVKPKNKSKRW